MNNQRRPIDPRRGGAYREVRAPRPAEQRRGQPQNNMNMQWQRPVHSQNQRPAPRPRPAEQRRPEMGEGYYQMPLRPITPMPRNEGQNLRRPQRPPHREQMPPARGPQRPPMQGQRPPMQGQRPQVRNQRPPVKSQRPMQRPEPVKKRRPPQRPGNGWVVPEGSPVYTAEGIMYDRGPQRRPQQNRRPAPPPPKKKKKIFNKEKFLLGVKTFFVRLGIMLL